MTAVAAISLGGNRCEGCSYVLMRDEGTTTATNMHWMGDASATSLAFEPFRVLQLQWLLTQDDHPVRIGSRAFEILLALLKRPGELVTKDELIARVWPSIFVEHANLALQIAGLRRVLGDGIRQARYVINIPGRRYRFVAPLTVETEFSSDAPAVGRATALPPKSRRPAANAEYVRELAQKLRQQAVLTVTPRSGGKSAVTLAVVENVLGGDDRYRQFGCIAHHRLHHEVGP